jgi:hypothetical protein
MPTFTSGMHASLHKFKSLDLFQDGRLYKWQMKKQLPAIVVLNWELPTKARLTNNNCGFSERQPP